MQLATLLFSMLPLASTLALDGGTETPCHECPQTVWYVDASTPASGPGTSWATAFRRLRTALNVAAPGDCIWVAAGVYKPTQSLTRSLSFDIDKELQIYGGFRGDELCLSDREGLFWDTVLSGDIGQPGVTADNSYTVVSVMGPLPMGQVLDVVLDGFRITGGYNDSAGIAGGGGLHARLGKLLLANCFLRRNEASLGGGLYSEGCDVAIKSTRLGRNVAFNGAGYYARGGRVRVFNSIFRRNWAASQGGGAYVEDLDQATPSDWVNVLFVGNQAQEGGALFLPQGVAPQPPWPWIDPGRAHLVGCTVTRNSAAVFGSGLAAIDHPTLVSLAGHLDVENSIIWNNTGPGPQIVGWLETWVVDSIVPPSSPFATGTNLSLDPLIAKPSFRPLAGSPAIDAGNPGWILPDALDLDEDGDLLEPTPLDLQRRARIQGAGVDMGATEH